MPFIPNYKFAKCLKKNILILISHADSKDMGKTLKNILLYELVKLVTIVNFNDVI